MKFKSFIYSVFTLYVVTIGFTLITSANFSDTQSHFYNTAIEYLKNEGIINGYSDGTFKPNNRINRAEFIKIIIGSISTNTEIENCNTSDFSDVNSSSWFSPYICVAKNKGIIKGYADGTFKPNENINFSEAAKIISESYGSNFSQTTPWYGTYFSWLDEKNAIPVSLSSASKKISRAEMSEMIWRIKTGKTNQRSMSYINNRLTNLASSSNTGSTSPTITSAQRQIYIKICKARNSSQTFESCMTQLLLSKN